MLQCDESRRIVRLIEDDKSSLLWLRDKDSSRTIQSIVSETSDLLEVNFDFDSEVFNSRAYQTAVRANMRQTLARKKGKMVQRDEPPSDDNVRDIDSRSSIESESDAQTVKANTVDLWRPSGGILVGITTELSQTDSIISEDNVASYGIAHPTSPPQDDIHKGQGNEPGSSLNREKPLPDVPSRLDYMPLGWATKIFSQAGAKMFKNEIQQQHEHLTDPKIVEHVPTSSGQSLAKRRDSLSSFSFKEGNMLKSFKSRLSLPSGLRQQPRTSQVPLAGINKSHLATYKVLKESSKCPKVLILGTSGAGKSTLLKSMTIFSGGTYSHLDRESCKETICSNIFIDINTILHAMKDFDIPLESCDKETYVKTISMYRWYQITELTPDIAFAIEALWSDLGVQECFRRLNKYQCHLYNSSG